MIAKPAALGATDRKAVTGVGRALVDVGAPEVEGHRGGLEAEAGEDEDTATVEREAVLRR